MVFGAIIFMRELVQLKKVEPTAKTPVIEKESVTQKTVVKRKPIVMDDEKAYQAQLEEYARRRPTI